MSRLLDAPVRRSAVPPAGHRRRRRTRAVRGRRGRAVAAIAALLVLVTVACTVPWVRHELRASFTRLPSTYTELYFDGTPNVEHGTAVVPVTLVAHGAAPRTYRLRVWLATASGRTELSRTVDLAPRAEVPLRTTVRLPYPRAGHGAAARTVVHVALLGQPQTLHYTLDDTPEGTS
ncbi:hypothetical protein ACWEWI_13560 [Streptomyces sp. NPDC003753]|uniref:hypothetical protein n=1 Tax=Streptomyces sp. Y2F8-2 TaxID=2759675 RepID=UPI001905794D|nr:hypothetical protein [Streptomyces sp. Y2F8-2]GHK02653.1 hypothetical protein SY2F82_44500 [Streptomyces sp. Y2F8-2]